MKKEMLVIAIIAAFGSISATAQVHIEKNKVNKSETKERKTERIKYEKQNKESLREALESDMQQMPEELKKKTKEQLRNL